MPRSCDLANPGGGGGYDPAVRQSNRVALIIEAIALSHKFSLMDIRESRLLKPIGVARRMRGEELLTSRQSMLTQAVRITGDDVFFEPFSPLTLKALTYNQL